jgi:hypothetical protein
MAWLDGRGARWGIFTATRQVRLLLRCLNVQSAELAKASPRHVESAAAWGSYYENDPRVLVVGVEDARRALDRGTSSVPSLLEIRSDAQASGARALAESLR